MKKVALTKKYKISIRKRETVSMEATYRISFTDTKKILQSSMKSAGIPEAGKIIQKNESAIVDLTKEIVETKHEVKSIRVLLERRTSKFEGLTEYDQHFIKTFAKQAAISLAETLTKKAVTPNGPKPIIYLSFDGDIYREPKSQYHFRIETSSRRMTLIRTLMESKKYVPTRTLIEITGLATPKSVRSAVYEIKQLVEKRLKVPNFIDGWQDSGYRINPNIILKKA